MRRRCLLIAMVAAFASSAFSVHYELIDLGTLPGQSASYAGGVNNRGEVVGESGRAFLWSASNGMVDLGSLESGSSSAGSRINDVGDIVGYAYASGGSDIRAVAWFDGNLTQLGSLGGRLSFADAVNCDRVVVGTAYLPGDEVGHAFIWRSGTMTDMSLLGVVGSESGASDVNDRGQVVGYYTGVSGSPSRAFIWDAASGMIDLGNLPGGQYRNFADAVNEQGQVVGRSGGRAFIWDSVLGMRDMGAIEDALYYAPYDVNSRGQAVGQVGFTDADPHAFIYDQGAMVDLNDLVSGDSPWLLTRAVSINDSGWIAGTGVVNGRERAFLAKPVPEPMSWAAFSLGAALLIRRKRR
jgi:probable HAF family extracellular repeat protein